jgi:hypothetical protein
MEKEAEWGEIVKSMNDKLRNLRKGKYSDSCQSTDTVKPYRLDLSGVVKKMKDLLHQFNLLVLIVSGISSPTSNLYVPHSSQADPVPACIKRKPIYHCLMAQRSGEAINYIREEMIVLVYWLAELHRTLKTKLQEILRPLSPRYLGCVSMSTHTLLELETRMKRNATRRAPGGHAQVLHGAGRGVCYSTRCTDLSGGRRHCGKTYI